MDLKIVFQAVAGQANQAINSVTNGIRGIANAARAAGASLGSSLGSGLARLGGAPIMQAFGAAAIVGYAKRTLDWADNLDALSQRLQISTRDLQVLDVVAKRSNLSLDTIATSFRHLTLAQARASGGKGEQFEAFTRLGVSLADIRSSRPIELWTQIGSAIERGGQSAQTLNNAVALLGKTADQVLPAMKEKLSEVAKEMERRGMLVSENMVASLAKYKQLLEETGTTANAVFAPILSGLMTGADAFVEFTKGGWRGFQSAYAGITGDRPGIRSALAADKQSGDEFVDRLARTYYFDSAAADEAARMEERLAAKRSSRDAATAEGPMSTWSEYEAMMAKDREQAVARRLGAGFEGQSRTADALTRMGLFRGSGGQQVLQSQLVELRRIVDQLQDLNREVRSEL